jgi:2,4-dienoyl-CoA reductase-like NADH-dependent reductase (Old Yellow Enzyme family)
MTNYWTPIRLGDIELEHRLAMAPTTRERSAANGAPTAKNAGLLRARATHLWTAFRAARGRDASIVLEDTPMSKAKPEPLSRPDLYQ